MKQQNNTEQKPLTPLQDKGNGHTPGEWFVSQSPIQANKTGIAFKSIKTTNKIGGRIIANVYIGNGFTLTENQKNELQANSELIASAPQLKAENEKQEDTIKELLEAIQFYQKGVDHFFKCINWGSSFLDAEAIQFMNDHGIKFSKAIAKHNQ